MLDPQSKNIIAAWADVLGGWPSDYVCFDIETTGLSIYEDYILQLGWLDSRPGSCKTGCAEFDWRNLPGIDSNTIERRLFNSYSNAPPGVFKIWSLNQITDGVDPISALADFYASYLDTDDQRLICAHNGARYDVPMLERHLSKYLCVDHKLDPDRTLDTGALVISLQTGAMPSPRKNLRDNCLDIIHKRTYTKWSLSNTCPQLFGWSVEQCDKSKAHGAGYDAMLVGMVMDECRKILEA